MASDDAEEAALRALPVDLDELADLLEGGDDVRSGLVDLQTGVVYPSYSEMSGEYLGLGEGFDPDEDPQLRHSALTHLAEAGVNLPLLMAKSGHQNLRSAQKYTRPVPRRSPQ